MSSAGRLNAPSAPAYSPRDWTLWARYLVAMLLCAITPTFAIAAAEPSQDPMLGQPAADFTLKSHAGNNLRLSEYRGQVVALVFWKNHCRDCMRELERWEALYRHHRDAGLRVLVIASDVTAAEAAATAQELRVGFPLLIDPQNRLAPQYLVTLMPTSVVVDKDGKQRYIHRGYRDTDDAVYETEIRLLLQEWR